MYVKKGKEYAILVMYNAVTDVKCIAKGPLSSNEVLDEVEDIMDTIEAGKFVCVSSHYLNPKDIVMVTIDLWKGKKQESW